MSSVKLTPVDQLILKLFVKVPWIELATFSDAGIVKRSINWTQAESLARAMRVPWNSFVQRRLEICQNVILRQESERMKKKAKKAKK